MKTKRLTQMIKKYGKEEGEKRYASFITKITAINRNKQISEETRKKIGQHSKGKNTLVGFISRYGEIEGTKKYNSFVQKSIHTEDSYIKRYGEQDGKKRWEEYRHKKKVTSKRSLLYWLNLFDGDEVLAKQSLHEYQQHALLERLIDKHGKIEGTKIYNDKRKNHSEFLNEYYLDPNNRERTKHTIDSYIKKYGEILGKQKYKEYYIAWKRGMEKRSMNGRHKNYSNISQMLFDNIIATFDSNISACYATFNYEFSLSNNDTLYFYDFTVPDLNLIIEFNGDYWHANPTLYNETFVHPVLNRTAKEIWDKDDIKIRVAKDNGYDVLIIWEKDYQDDPNKVLTDCITFINRRLNGKNNS